jgi:hypothetical protein
MLLEVQRQLCHKNTHNKTKIRILPTSIRANIRHFKIDQKAISFHKILVANLHIPKLKNPNSLLAIISISHKKL